MHDLENDRILPSNSFSDCVHIGRGTYWHPASRFHTYVAGEKIIVGRYCSIAEDVFIASGGEHHLDTVSTWPFDNFIFGIGNPSRTYRRKSDTIVGSDVWIGHGAHVFGGCNVGHGAVIGARAVVSKDVPPYAIVVGNPARIVRHRFDERTRSALLAIA